MSASQYIPQEQVYSSAVTKVTVYKSLDSATGQVVAVKWLGFRSKTQADSAIREFRIQKSLQHPNICQVLNYFQQTAEDGTLYTVLVTEWMDKSDLYKDISNRKKNEFPWKEEELWMYIRGLVGALAYAQNRKISHRDIKPQNIFMNSRNQVKIGDFGSAFETTEAPEGDYDLVGTPYFLSPSLRNAMMTSIPNAKVKHDPFKSDVFSLGLTFLYMARLEPPLGSATPFVSESIHNAVSCIRYSDMMKQMLNWMLTFEEDPRPNFLAIELWLNPSPETTPELVLSQSEPIPYSDQTEVKCPTCFLLFPRQQHIQAEWRSSYPNCDNYCSAECYLIMKDVYEPHDPADFFLCAFCRQWTHDPWLFDCKNHGVCSKKCGRALMENTTKLLRDNPVCPECSEPLTWATTAMKFFDGAEDTPEEEKATTATSDQLFEAAQRNLRAKMCESCMSVKAERMYGCGHVYCSDCFYLDAQENGGFLKCPHPSGCGQVYFIREGK